MRTYVPVRSTRNRLSLRLNKTPCRHHDVVSSEANISRRKSSTYDESEDEPCDNENNEEEEEEDDDDNYYEESDVKSYDSEGFDEGRKSRGGTAVRFPFLPSDLSRYTSFVQQLSETRLVRTQGTLQGVKEPLKE